MRWFETPDWAEFTKRVIDSPADDTVRVVSADWLEDNHGDDQNAVVRARLIRWQCLNGGDAIMCPVLHGSNHPDFIVMLSKLGYDPYDYHKFNPFPEVPLDKTRRFVVARGFVEQVTFDPWRFTKDNVTPVFASCPVRICYLDGVHPVQNHRRDSRTGAPAGVWWHFHCGPGSYDGEIDETDDPEHLADIERAGSIMAYYELGNGIVPGPVYNYCRSNYPTAAYAAVAVCKAAFHVGRMWATGRGKFVGAPEPDAGEVEIIVRNSLAWLERERIEASAGLPVGWESMPTCKKCGGSGEANPPGLCRVCGASVPELE